MQRQPNTEYILSLSYGKDSIACLEAIKLLGYPLDRIIHAEVWATDTIPADLPPMVEFKNYADQIILDRYGIEVEHICAVSGGRERERERERATFERIFYTKYYSRKDGQPRIYGFPIVRGAWCNSNLKLAAIKQANQRNLRKNVLSHTQKKTEHQENGDIWVSDIGSKGQLVHGVENSGFLIAPYRAL